MNSPPFSDDLRPQNTSMGSPHHVFVLLVDDMHENLVALEALLRRDGITLLKARNGSDALELLLQHDVALALIDVQMPDMDGFELAELMRGTQRTRRVPIIFLTAGTATIQRRFRGYEAGAVDFLQKPLEPDILRSKVEVFIELDLQRLELARQRDELRAAMDDNSRLLAESRQYAAALQQADRRKDEFLAILAHELRNPLAPIRNAIQILNQLQPGPEERAHLHGVIDRQVQHMVRLVDELLEVSRITQGKITLQQADVDLNEIVRQAVETCQALIQMKSHELAVSLPELPPIVHGDAVRLTQVVSNLLNNAAKYTPAHGQIELTVEADQGWATIRLRDSGIGIPSDRLEAVFDLFTQLRHHHDHSEGGLGIGLTLVKALVELHQGTISVTSRGEGQGTEFTVRLKLVHSEVSLHQEPTTLTPATTSPRRVLIIDDNVDAAICLMQLLQALGHEVAVAHDGYSGIEQVNLFRPEVVLLDLGMPGIDGFETARRIRSVSAGKNLVLAALTGWGQDDIRRRTAELGFEYHLLKPVEIPSLTEVLARDRRPGADASSTLRRAQEV